MKADLHCHTLLSDGTLGIEEIIQVAKKSGLDAIAITDHDTLAGTKMAENIGRRHGVTVIPGVEFSCTDTKRGRKVHLLCYMPDSPERLEGICNATATAGKLANQMMLARVVAKYPLTVEMIQKCAKSSTGIYKQHVMQALNHIGYADGMFGEVYHELFDEKSAKRVALPIKYPDVFSVLKEILNAGGIAVLAHPYLYDSTELLDELVEKGLCGVEAWHPTMSEEQTAKMLQYAAKHKLLAIGGSDFHGCFAEHNSRLGDVLTPEENYKELMGYKAKVKRQKRKAEKAAQAQ